MAILKSDIVTAGNPERAPHVGVFSVTAKYTLTAALALNDVLQMIPVPEGAHVIDTILDTDDLDTGGVPAIVLDVGDDLDPNRYIAGSTVGQAGGRERGNVATPKDFKYAANNTIDITVATGPQTGAVAGDVVLTAIMTMDM